MDTGMSFGAYAEARHATLLRAAVLLGCPQTHAEYVVHTTLTKCLQSWHRVSGADDQDAYVDRILLTTLKVFRRRLWKGSYPPETADLPDWLTSLRREEREALVLRFFLDLSEAGAADVLGVRRATVRNRALKAMAAVPAMHSEDHARDLLLQAAGSIQVGPAEVPHGTPPRSARPLVAVTASLGVVGAVVLAFAFVSNSGSGGGPDDRKTPPPPRPHFRLATDQIPSVFALDVDRARTLLESKGLQVEQATKESCELPSRALETVPGTGTRFAKGDRVVLLSPEAPPGADCEQSGRTFVWQLLDFANGEGPPPPLADEVTLFVNDAPHVTRTRDELAESRRWGFCLADVPGGCPTSALMLLADAAQQVQAITTGGQTSYVTPGLGAELRRPATVCDHDAPVLLKDREALVVAIEIPTDAPQRCSEWYSVDLYLTPEDTIDAVVLRLGTPADDPETPGSEWLDIT